MAPRSEKKGRKKSLRSRTAAPAPYKRVWTYRARNSEGKVVCGKVRATDYHETLAALRKRELSPIWVRERPRKSRKIEWVHEALTVGGETAHGEVAAASPEEAIVAIRNKGLFPTNVQEKGKPLPRIGLVVEG